jgi:hypothetical protein
VKAASLAAAYELLTEAGLSGVRMALLKFRAL